MNISLKIMVMGTRGKSSLIDLVAHFLRENNYKVLSRQTGLVPVVTYQDSYFYLKRNRFDMGFDRPMETKIVLEYFQKKYEIDCLVIESNAISEYHMSKLSQYVKPDITIITTISPDHIIDQGLGPEATAKIFLNSLYSKTLPLFYSNHDLEIEVMKRVSSKLGIDIPIIHSPLAERNEQVIQKLSNMLNKLNFKVTTPNVKEDNFTHKGSPLKSEMMIKLDDDKLLINLGSVNDLLHTQIFIDEVRKHYEGPYYLMLNFREDREDRAWLFMNYILPKISDTFDGVIIRSDHPAFSEAYIKRHVNKNYPLIICLTTSSLEDFKSRTVKRLPRASKIIVLANTANDFGFDMIDEYKLFQESYPVLREVSIGKLN